MGTTTWSPLASGLLTGKYAKDVVPADSRLAQPNNAWLLKELTESRFNMEVKDLDAIFDKVEKLKPIAAKLGCSLAVLSIAWVLKNKNVSTVITGASRPSQVAENLTALDVAEKLTAEVMAEIEAAVQTKPVGPRDWGRGVDRID